MLLKELEYLSEIAKYENLSQAARELNVTQSALSQCLASLEADLGMALFSRVKNRLRITPEGILYLQTARKMLDVRNAMYNRLRAYKDQGSIRIGLGSAHAVRVLSRVLLEGREKYSHWDLSITEARSPALLHQLNRGNLDFIIIVRDRLLDLEDCHVHLIRRDPLMLLMSSAHPLASSAASTPGHVWKGDISRFVNDPFILEPKETVNGLVALRILEKYCPGYRVACTINNTLSLTEMVRNGFGVTITSTPSFCFSPERSSIDILEPQGLSWILPQEPFFRYIQLVCRKDHSVTRAEASLFQEIQAVYEQDGVEEGVGRVYGLY
ncbi:MAG: LysR family transcriptional regulator [Lachnospiraceae bacterium]|jgi:DNA-binding transcriptional LysR family regulator|nr:LysR family transcriptional regulator [Lachnospiraceae bacterium]